jgi:hypothetical protein
MHQKRTPVGKPPRGGKAINMKNRENTGTSRHRPVTDMKNRNMVEKQACTKNTPFYNDFQVLRTAMDGNGRQDWTRLDKASVCEECRHVSIISGSMFKKQINGASRRTQP